MGVKQTITCIIQDNIQNEKDLLWVSWNYLRVELESNKLCFERPDGIPNQHVRVQVYSFDTPITKVAIYTYHDTGNIQSMFV